MPTSPPGSTPDPMAREVDRLLAQLANSAPRAAHDHPPSQGNGKARRTRSRKPRTVVLSAHGPSRSQLLALWVELVLATALGGAITQWPYSHRCGLPLLGYSTAVGVVVLAGGWLALGSWRLRAGFPHVLALMLLAWGLVLTAGEILPRMGYAADRETWRCSSTATAIDRGPEPAGLAPT